jgi:lipoate-protein ligase A
MISRARKKVKEGKVIKVEVEYDEVIKNIRITGDFFLHPEDILDKIEKSIIGLNKTVSEEAIVSNINRIIAAEDVQMIGISPESIAGLVKEALNS